MTTPLTLASMFVAASRDAILATGLALAKVLKLPVESWQPGDPTRSYYYVLAEVLSSLEGTYADFIKAGFLSSATRQWLTILAWEVYGVQRVEATYATSTITVENEGTGYYTFEREGDLLTRSTVSGKTYRNAASSVSGGPIILGPGDVVSFSVVADEAGSGSSAGVDEIDDFVTPYLGLVVTASTVAVGVDEQEDDSLKAQCSASLGALSPNGPADAYAYVCRNPELTGALDITRARAFEAPGVVTVYLAGAAGPVLSESIDLADDAIHTWATPLGITSSTAHGTAITTPLTVELSGVLPTNFATTVATKYAALCAKIDFEGTLARSKIDAMLHESFPGLVTANIVSPVYDVVHGAGQYPIAGAVVVSQV